MPDVAIVDRAVTAAPKDYLIPAGQEIRLRAARASFDATGASDVVYPALQLIAPDGTVMWTAQTSGYVAVGGSADASWFPGLAGGASGAGAGLTRVFDYTVPTGTTVTTIDTSGHTFDNTLNALLVSFMGISTSATNPDYLAVQFNGDTSGNYDWSEVKGEYYGSGGPTTVFTGGNNLDNKPLVCRLGANSNVANTTGCLMFMPQRAGDEDAALLALGGYTSGVSARIGMAVVHWSFRGVTRLTFRTGSGSDFYGGTRVIVWTL